MLAQGEPNDAYGTTGEDAVAISFRGGQRLGRWNDETHSPDTSGFSWGMNYPLCQTTVPPSDHTKTRVWGAGQTHSLNLRICVDADDYRAPSLLRLYRKASLTRNRCCWGDSLLPRRPALAAVNSAKRFP